MEFFPSVNQQQTEDNFSKTFLSRDLPEIVTFRKAQAAQNTKNSLHRMVREAIEDEKPVKEIILEIKDSMTRTSIQEQDAIVMVCTCLVLVPSVPSARKLRFGVFTFWAGYRQPAQKVNTPNLCFRADGTDGIDMSMSQSFLKDFEVY